MGIKKKQFSDFEDLKNYITSAKARGTMIFSKNSERYPGVVESLTFYSTRSGKKLDLHHTFESYGLDWMGDLSEHISYHIESLDSFKEVLDKPEIDLKELIVMFSLPENFQRTTDGKTEMYQKGWKDLCKDFKSGKLFIEGLQVKEDS